MNELVKQWVYALRNGGFKQGNGALRSKGPDGDEYCCLGVLCQVVGVEWELADYGVYRADGYSMAYLPPKVARQAEATDGLQSKLAKMNDYHRSSFEEIASAIEAHFGTD